MNNRHHHCRHVSGFTLVELLVVVFLIGLISGFALLSVNSRGDDREVTEELKRLRYKLTLASEEAVVQGQPVGVYYEGGGYHFLTYQKGLWSEVTQSKALKSEALSRQWQLELRLGGKRIPLTADADETEKDADAASQPAPQVVFYPSGEVDVFDLWVVSQDKQPKFRIWYREDGVIALDSVTDNDY